MVEEQGELSQGWQVDMGAAAKGSGMPNNLIRLCRVYGNMKAGLTIISKYAQVPSRIRLATQSFGGCGPENHVKWSAIIQSIRNQLHISTGDHK